MIRPEKRTLLKIPVAGILSLTINAATLVGRKSDMPPFEMLVYRLFGSMVSDSKEMFLIIVQNIIFIVLFSALFSGYISAHFRYSCVYVFSRLKSRRRWFAERALELMITAALYAAVYIGVTLMICCASSNAPFLREHLGSLLLLYLCALLITVNITLGINLLSLRFGSTVSFFVVQAALAGFIYLALNTAVSAPCAWLNPLSCILILDAPTPYLPILGSVIILILLFFGGMAYVDRYDIALFDPEIN